MYLESEIHAKPTSKKSTSPRKAQTARNLAHLVRAASFGMCGNLKISRGFPQADHFAISLLKLPCKKALALIPPFLTNKERTSVSPPNPVRSAHRIGHRCNAPVRSVRRPASTHDANGGYQLVGTLRSANGGTFFEHASECRQTPNAAPVSHSPPLTFDSSSTDTAALSPEAIATPFSDGLLPGEEIASNSNARFTASATGGSSLPTRLNNESIGALAFGNNSTTLWEHREYAPFDEGFSKASPAAQNAQPCK